MKPAGSGSGARVIRAPTPDAAKSHEGEGVPRSSYVRSRRAVLESDSEMEAGNRGPNCS